MNWSNIKGCIACEKDCDSCTSFKRIPVQHCKRCGKDFLNEKALTFVAIAGQLAYIKREKICNTSKKKRKNPLKLCKASTDSKDINNITTLIISFID